jgi:hypothetical protein
MATLERPLRPNFSQLAPEATNAPSDSKSGDPDRLSGEKAIGAGSGWHGCFGAANGEWRWWRCGRGRKKNEAKQELRKKRAKTEEYVEEYILVENDPCKQS